MQFIARVAATQEGPIGVEAALLARGAHLTLIHIWGWGRWNENPGRLSKGIPSPQPGGLAWPSLTHTGAVVGPQLEAWFTLTAEGARQVDTAVLAVAVAALVDVCGRGGRGRAEARWDLRPLTGPVSQECGHTYTCTHLEVLCASGWKAQAAGGKGLGSRSSARSGGQCRGCCLHSPTHSGPILR